jgi:hypothetical protein
MEEERFSLLMQRFDSLESQLAALVQQRTAKEHYSSEEIGQIFGKSEYTAREWCRLGRINAEKKGSGRGKYRSWVVSHSELLRIQRDGLLPIRR